jgi:hypothetical protein
MPALPCVSVIVVADGMMARDPALVASLESILTQTHRKRECLVVTSGPHFPVLPRFQSNRVRGIMAEAASSREALMVAAAEAALSEYVAIWNPGDLAHPARLAAQLNRMVAADLPASVLGSSLLLDRERGQIYWLDRGDCRAAMDQAGLEATWIGLRSQMLGASGFGAASRIDPDTPRITDMGHLFVQVPRSADLQWLRTHGSRYARSAADLAASSHLIEHTLALPQFNIPLEVIGRHGEIVLTTEQGSS